MQVLQGVADKKGSIKALSLGAKIKRKGATLGREEKKQVKTNTKITHRGATLGVTRGQH